MIHLVEDRTRGVLDAKRGRFFLKFFFLTSLKLWYINIFLSNSHHATSALLLSLSLLLIDCWPIAERIENPPARLVNLPIFQRRRKLQRQKVFLHLFPPFLRNDCGTHLSNCVLASHMEGFKNQLRWSSPHNICVHTSAARKRKILHEKQWQMQVTINYHLYL